LLDVAQTVPVAALVEDALARRQLQSAQGAFQKWPEGFQGFTARIVCRADQTELAGEVRVTAGGPVDVSLSQPGLAAWATAALRAIAAARTPRFFKDGDGRFRISFDGPDAALDRRIRVDLGDDLCRTYRIDGKGRIREEETVSPARRTRLTYDELVRTSPGRVVPTRMRVLDWDVTAQTTLESAEIEDDYCCVDYVVLPVRRRTTRLHGADSRTLSMELDRHVILRSR
jgi:hypothetical protein